MKRSLIVACTMFLLSGQIQPASAEVVVKGAGASFPYPIYAWWSLRHGKVTDTKIEYDSIGSGGGIKRILAGDVDFGATDAPLSPSELEKNGLIQFATVLGGVVPVLNLPGIPVGELKLSGQVLADIFMGRVKSWNDKSIRALNPEFKLPELAITVVHRTKGSGTTWVFTNYLSKVNSSFKQKVGTGKLVNWPVGVGEKGNQGIVDKVHATPGAIGYTEYAYALQSSTNYTMLLNKAGTYVHPNRESFQAAANSVDWSHSSADVILTDKDGANAWPITAATFILMHKKQADLQKLDALLKFFDWCYRDGGQYAELLDYVPLSVELTDKIRQQWAGVYRQSKVASQMATIH